jgi:ATP-dependent DNA ligase
MPRPKYYDLEPGDFGAQLEPYDFVELKYDGLYAEFIGDEHGWSIHGRNGRLLRYGEEPCPKCYLRGEMIIETEWAARSELYGSFVAWDCIYDGEAIPQSLTESKMRLEAMIPPFAKHGRAHLDHSSAIDVREAEGLWLDYPEYEGLVFRSADGQRYGRMKRVVTQDYVVTGVRATGSRVTALYGGAWIKKKFQTVCIVPIKAPVVQMELWPQRFDLVGRVFEAKGNAVLRSGALRHPRQAGKAGAVKWRPDKRAEECKL